MCSLPPDDLAAAAYDHIAFLAGEIGPRPAGSPAAAAARSYIKDQLSQWGYQPEEQEVDFARPPRIDGLLPLTGLTLSLVSWFLPRLPWLALLLPMWGAAIPQVSRWLIFRRPRREGDFNLVARTTPTSDAPILVLCAHYDSAPASVFRRPWIRKLQHRLYNIYQRAAVALALIAVAILLRFPIQEELLWIIRVAGAFVGAWITLTTCWEQIAPRRKFSPGANDNASGVGVLLALAAHYAQSPPENLQLRFLFSAAEETGMHGARAYANVLTHLSERLVGVINLDMVGRGDTLRFARRDGTLAPAFTAKALNEIICKAEPHARPIDYTIKSSDYLPFLRKNLPAASLEVTGDKQAALDYHSAADQFDRIQRNALELTLAAMQNVVRLAGADKRS